jgi:hypothetical protein
MAITIGTGIPWVLTRTRVVLASAVVGGGVGAGVAGFGPKGDGFAAVGSCLKGPVPNNDDDCHEAGHPELSGGVVFGGFAGAKEVAVLLPGMD